MIIGTNGAGKSTILDALTFSLFNKPFRKINKPQLVNSVNEKDCQVEVEFDIKNKKYKIVRGLKPAKFEIWIDGESCKIKMHLLLISRKSWSRIFSN